VLDINLQHRLTCLILCFNITVNVGIRYSVWCWEMRANTRNRWAVCTVKTRAEAVLHYVFFIQECTLRVRGK
jgi:hypothetical protein